VSSAGAGAVLRQLGFRKPALVQTEIGADERVWTPAGVSGPAREFTVVFVGPLVAQKGIEDLARAAVGLKGEYRLVVAGDGPERQVLERTFAEAGAGARLNLRGFVRREELPAVVRESDVLVLPSRTRAREREQFGLVLAEAMLCSTAVVGSDSGAIPEVIGEGGLVFPEGDWQALRGVLQSLADNPARRIELARRGRDRALRLYSATALADHTYDLYMDLAGREQVVAP
jgi:glycosyltransferase involved in cell wall biosynthesis